MRSAVWVGSQMNGWWLPPINTRGGGENRDTPPSWSSHPLQAFSLVQSYLRVGRGYRYLGGAPVFGALLHFCTSTRVREQFRRSAGCQLSAPSLYLYGCCYILRYLVSIRGSYLQYYTWFSVCQQCLQLSEISSLTRGFIALYSYRVIQFGTGIHT